MPKHSSRPHMPGYGIMPAEEGAGLLPYAWAEERLAAAHNYWVCTVTPSGQPHAAPVWGVWHVGAFYFGTGESSRKGRNLAANPQAVLHLESGDEVVIIEGIVEPVSDPALLAVLDKAYQAKYKVPFHLAMCLRPHTAFAWREQDFPGSATRFDLGGE